MKRVFVNGTFDVLHKGHLALFEFAKSFGDYLLVALDSDERVKLLKGATRPLNTLDTRLAIINSLKPVDEVTSFNSDLELEAIILNYSPDVMIVGSDWRGKSVIGSQYANRLVYFERTISASTSAVLDSYCTRLRENYL
jgi:D-beta-D-heptose 7-phosphate kinase/D-beta-D-heptose 1-phosphate adenosyltransferase